MADAMQIRQIKYFLVVCEELSFTRAAKRCNVAQPSLTKAIRALESQVGGTLFRRRPHVELSALGHSLRPYFEKVVRSVEKAYEIAHAFETRCREPEPPTSSAATECG